MIFPFFMKKIATKRVSIAIVGMVAVLFCVVALMPDVWAQTERTVNLQVPFPGTEGGKLTVCNTDADGQVTCGGISEYIIKAYQWTIGFVMILAVLMLVYAGLLWMTPGSVAGSKEGEHTSNVQKAKTVIRNSLVGLVLAIGSYVFLYAINPDLTKLPELSLGKKVEKINLEIKEADVTENDIPDDDVVQPPVGVGNVPFYSQGAMPWRTLRSRESGKLFKNIGCGITSFAMIAKYYGKNVTPEDIFKVNGETANTNLGPLSAHYGLKTENIPRSDFSKIHQLVTSGHPILMYTKNRKFTSHQHFVVITGFDGTNYTINDPNGGKVKTASKEELLGPVMPGNGYTFPRFDYVHP